VTDGLVFSLAARARACCSLPDGGRRLGDPFLDVNECPKSPTLHCSVKKLPSKESVSSVKGKILEAGPNWCPMGSRVWVRGRANILSVGTDRDLWSRCRRGWCLSLSIPPMLPRPARW
jgi:hypothetical protein